jgi:hypothetical protein
MSEVLIQRALQMSAPTLLSFVRKKALSRAQLRLVIEDLAAARRVPSQTRKQAYDEFVTKDTLAIELHRILAATARPQIDGHGPASLRD